MAALALIFLSACTARRPTPPRVSATDPETLLAEVQQHEAQIGSLRARFTAETRTGAEQHATDGVLLVKKPDRFRLRLMLPIGLTVFDYVSSGTRAQMSLPLAGRVTNEPPTDDTAAFSQQDLGQAFLRGPYAFPGTCTPLRPEAGEVIVTCRDGSGDLLRQIRIDPAHATIDDETSYVAGRPRLVIRYSDYRAVDDLLLPYRIAMLYPERDMAVTIAIQRYEVNPTLADRLFEPAGQRTGS